MPLLRTQKTDVVAGLQAEFAECRNAILIDYLGLTVDEVNDLRQRIRDSNGKYRVVKNTLAHLALEGTPLAELQGQLTGPIAIAYHPENPIDLAKTMTGFVKEHSKVVEIKAGVMDGNLATPDVIQQFATMGSEKELHAKLVYLLQSPLQRTITLFQAVQRNLTVVLSEGAKKKGSE